VTHPTAGFTVACEKEAGVAEVPQLLDVIFFDAGSILFTTHRKHQARIEAILTARGYPADLQASALAAAEQVAQLANIQKHWFDTWAEEQVHWSRYYGALAAAMPDAPPSFADELFYLCHFVAHCTVYEDVHATLSELGQRYRLAVISNAYPSLDWVFDRLDLRRYFVHITLSAFAGCAKPDPRIYRIALEAVQCKPQRAFFVDNKERNVEAARSVGMGGIALLRTAPPARGYLATLRELPAHLAVYEHAMSGDAG
jgi:putative hydrolase of the HAD superfamily